jgi:membrane protease YdiL (CAAX protease family)
LFLTVCFVYRFPTPVCILVSAALFAFAHLTPGQFPQLFILGNFICQFRNKI